MTDSDVTTKVVRAETWIKQHERLILAVIGGAILWLSIGKIDTLIINHDAANLQQAKVTAQVQADKNATLAAQAAQQAEQYKALAEQVAKQNAALENANVQLSLALSKQQKKDATLPPTELAQRWRELVPSYPEHDPSPVVSLDTGAITVTPAGAIATVQELEKVPVLSSQLENSRTQIENGEKLLEGQHAVVLTLSDQVDGLKLQLVDDAKVCKAQVAEVKAQARKGKRTWFTIGYVAGIATRGAIKLLAGI
jgi:hypothetical protein